MGEAAARMGRGRRLGRVPRCEAELEGDGERLDPDPRLFATPPRCNSALPANALQALQRTLDDQDGMSALTSRQIESGETESASGNLPRMLYVGDVSVESTVAG